MPDPRRQGLVKRQVLTEAEVTEIGRLIAICDDYEGLHMRLGLDMLRSRPGDEAHDFLYYEDDRLAGYLAVDGCGGEERELTGMFRPDYRSRGIFRMLVPTAKQECERTVGESAVVSLGAATG